MSYSALADVPDEKLIALGQRAEREASRRHFADFCALVDPAYESARHTRLLCEKLEAVERGEIKRLAVFMPPRHGKTMHVSERFPAWYIGRNPKAQVILASYGAELAEANSRRARNLLEHPHWPFPVNLAKDSTAVNRWHTEAGGVVTAAGVGGAITGFGAHVLIIDDPVKGREEADSETYRERAWQWYLEVARTRLMPGGAIVLCQTRWHQDDLAGRILASGTALDWTLLDLPAFAGEGDALGRADGEPLWPEWFGYDALLGLRAELGSRAWSALYQQSPTTDEGGFFKRAWMLRRWTELPEKPLRKVITVDAGFKTGIMNDYSVLAVWATDGIDYYLVDLWRGRVESPELNAAIVTMAERHGRPAVHIEDTAHGTTAIQTLRRTTNLAIVAEPVKGSKESRAEGVTGYFEALKVVLPAHQPWVEDWIEEHAAFPTGRHDDMVDTTSMALKKLANWKMSLADQPRSFRIIPGGKPQTDGLIAESRRGFWQAEIARSKQEASA